MIPIKKPAVSGGPSISLIAVALNREPASLRAWDARDDGDGGAS
jgi:hypothetical protein